MLNIISLISNIRISHKIKNPPVLKLLILCSKLRKMMMHDTHQYVNFSHVNTLNSCKFQNCMYNYNLILISRSVLLSYK